MELCIFSFVTTLHVLTKIVVCLIGATSLYCASFLYEDEEGKLQNRIEQLWVSIDERRRLNQSAALLNRVAMLVNRIVNRVVGKRLFSFRMVAITTCFSLAAMQFWLSIIIYRGMIGVTLGTMQLHVEMSTSFLWGIFRNDLYVFLGLLGAGLLASRLQRWWSTALCYFVIGIVLWFTDVVPIYLPRPAAMLGISLLSDIFVLAAVRWTLRRLIRKSDIGSFVIAIVIQLSAIIILVIVPWTLGTGGPNITQESSDSVSLGWIMTPSYELFGLNTFTGMFCLMFVAILAFMLTHKTLWPAASRLLYPIARFQIVRNRKLMVAISITSFAIISPPFAELLKKASEWFK